MNETKDNIAEKAERVEFRNATSKQFEMDFFNFVCSKINNELLSNRLRYLLHWYDNRARHYKGLYHRYRNFTSILPSLITIMSVTSFFWEDSRIPTVGVVFISIAITIVHHRMDHYRRYENWVRYRGTAEALKRETMLFLNHCSPYNTKTNIEAELLFATEIERISSEEYSKWENLREDSHQMFLSIKDEQKLAPQADLKQH